MYFGIWLEGKLTYETYINVLLSKAKSCIGFLYYDKIFFMHSAKQFLVKKTVGSQVCFRNAFTIQ